MHFEMVWLWTDIVYWCVITVIFIYMITPKSSPTRAAWDQVWQSKIGISMAVVVVC